ncbi:MAG: hypothetical protein MZV65_54650 [Chromatiales bacterium]|nr:hypothetical protein [Chromatiales bacterium]
MADIDEVKLTHPPLPSRRIEKDKPRRDVEERRPRKQPPRRRTARTMPRKSTNTCNGGEPW